MAWDFGALRVALLGALAASAAFAGDYTEDFESGSVAVSGSGGTASVVADTTGESGYVVSVSAESNSVTVQIPVSLSGDYDELSLDFYPVDGGGINTLATGFDLSLLKAYLDAGTSYKDTSGVTHKDPLAWFDSLGINYVRCRLFVDPTKATLDEEYMTQIPQDLDYVVEFAKDIKAAGQKFLLDIHYSDEWADPSKQYMPYSWSSISSQSVLQDSVYTYTKRVLQTLIDNDVTPDMVQVGNEISYGMFFYSTTDPKYSAHAMVQYSGTYSGSTYWQNFTNILSKGAAAVRELCPNAKIMIHIERTGDASTTKQFYTNLETYGVDYDVIGLSYYPIWHNTLKTLGTTLSTLESAFPDKEIMLAEFGYYYQWFPSSYSYDESVIGYYATTSGQASFVNDLIDTCLHHSGVTGIFYWFPEENESTNAGIYSNWWNTGLFDNSSGKANPALYKMQNYTNAGSSWKSYSASISILASDGSGNSATLATTTKKFSSLDEWYGLDFDIDLSSLSFTPTYVSVTFENSDYDYVWLLLDNLELTSSGSDSTFILKCGSGRSSQTITLGDSIDTFCYAYDNAEGISVTGLPSGVSVEEGTVNASGVYYSGITISGTPTETGVFSFTVTTVGGITGDSTRTGKITVNASDSDSDSDGSSSSDSEDSGSSSSSSESETGGSSGSNGDGEDTEPILAAAKLAQSLSVRVSGMSILVEGAEGSKIAVYSVSGAKVSSVAQARSSEALGVARPGVYLVKVGNSVKKAVVQAR